MKRIIALFTAGLMILPAQTGPTEEIPTTNPFTTEADVIHGRRLFAGHCAPCHGPAGEGGRGANLARLRLPRAPDDRTLHKVIRDGINGTEMPGAWEMISKEIWQVAAFIRSLGRAEMESVPGDASRGEALFRGKGNCTRCHSVKGQGGRIGPDLSEIGLRRGPAYLRQSVLEPDASVPEDFLQVRLKTRDARQFTGIRLNEDTFSIQMQDLSDRLHSFWKSDLTEIRKDRGKSPMPSYKGVFSGAELDDLIAYMVSLRGAL